MLFLDDIRGSRKYAEGCLALIRLRGKVELKQGSKKFRPGLVCRERKRQLDIVCTGAGERSPGRYGQRTAFHELPRNLSDGITDLVPNRALGF